MKTSRIARRLVKNWWNVHGLPYCMQKIEEENQVSFGVYYLQATLCGHCLIYLFLSSLKLMKALEVNAPMRALKRGGDGMRVETSMRGASALETAGDDTEAEANVSVEALTTDAAAALVV
jgi:hypothetical protein